MAHDARTAGAHTRKESGYLVEVAQEAALRQSRHIWVDGSLRDAAWYESVFNDLRRRHPSYQIAILCARAVRSYATAPHLRLVE